MYITKHHILSTCRKLLGGGVGEGVQVGGVLYIRDRISWNHHVPLFLLLYIQVDKK